MIPTRQKSILNGSDGKLDQYGYIQTKKTADCESYCELCLCPRDSDTLATGWHCFTRKRWIWICLKCFKDDNSHLKALYPNRYEKTKKR